MSQDGSSSKSYIKHTTEKARLEGLAFTSFPEDYLPYTSPSYQRKAPYLVWDDQQRQYGRLFGSTRRQQLRRCCCGTTALVAAIVLLVAAILAIVAVSVYLGVITNLFRSPIFSMSGKFRVLEGDHFDEVLLNHTSYEFLTKADLYRSLVENMLTSSSLHPAFVAARVYAFRRGSLLVFFRVHLDRRKLQQSEEEALLITKNLLQDQAVVAPSPTFDNLILDALSIDVREYGEEEWLMVDLQTEDPIFYENFDAKSPIPSEANKPATGRLGFSQDPNEAGHVSQLSVSSTEGEEDSLRRETAITNESGNTKDVPSFSRSTTTAATPAAAATRNANIGATTAVRGHGAVHYGYAQWRPIDLPPAIQVSSLGDFSSASKKEQRSQPTGVSAAVPKDAVKLQVENPSQNNGQVVPSTIMSSVSLLILPNSKNRTVEVRKNTGSGVVRAVSLRDSDDLSSRTDKERTGRLDVSVIAPEPEESKSKFYLFRGKDGTFDGDEKYSNDDTGQLSRNPPKEQGFKKQESFFDSESFSSENTSLYQAASKHVTEVVLTATSFSHEVTEVFTEKTSEEGMLVSEGPSHEANMATELPMVNVNQTKAIGETTPNTILELLMSDSPASFDPTEYFEVTTEYTHFLHTVYKLSASFSTPAKKLLPELNRYSITSGSNEQDLTTIKMAMEDVTQAARNHTNTSPIDHPSSDDAVTIASNFDENSKPYEQTTYGVSTGGLIHHTPNSTHSMQHVPTTVPQSLQKSEDISSSIRTSQTSSGDDGTTVFPVTAFASKVFYDDVSDGLPLDGTTSAESDSVKDEELTSPVTAIVEDETGISILQSLQRFRKIVRPLSDTDLNDISSREDFKDNVFVYNLGFPSTLPTVRITLPVPLDRVHNNNNESVPSTEEEKDNAIRLTTTSAPSQVANVSSIVGLGKNPTFRNHRCSEDELPCDSGECIPSDYKCNMRRDCRDNSDEQSCSCSEYLGVIGQPQKICDGVRDCWDLSDEENCPWCRAGQFLCPQSKFCVNMSQVCDGTNDCPFGTDERHCVKLAEDEENVPGVEEYHAQGYLMVRKAGKWGKLCLGRLNDITRTDPKKLEDLGRAVCSALSYRELEEAVEIRDSAERSSLYYEIATQPVQQPSHRNSAIFSSSVCQSKDVVHVKCGSLECGLRPMAISSSRRRIVGGHSTGSGSWPWQVALYKEGDFQCGAVLVSDSWLLSAGHCFYSTQTAYWSARLGILRRGTELPSPSEYVRRIIQIIIHPDYVDKGFINDIALLRLEKPVPFSDYLRPVCLPLETEDVKYWHGQHCSVVGWGKLFEIGHTFPDSLQEVRLPVVSTEECRKRIVFLSMYHITDNMFCAGYERGGRDACLGDSGGPLMCQRQDGRWVLLGITSNGDGCGRPGRPGVYTKVTQYLHWINQAMSTQFDHSNSTNKCSGQRCLLGRCVQRYKVCDGRFDCADGSDEMNCGT